MQNLVLSLVKTKGQIQYQFQKVSNDQNFLGLKLEEKYLQLLNIIIEIWNCLVGKKAEPLDTVGIIEVVIDQTLLRAAILDESWVVSHLGPMFIIFEKNWRKKVEKWIKTIVWELLRQGPPDLHLYSFWSLEHYLSCLIPG